MRVSYARALEHSPRLLERLEEAASETLDLRNEAALARALLTEVLSALGKAHGSTGILDAAGLDLILTQLKQVTDIVTRGAEIESKKTDQRIEISKLVVLLASLRDDMRRNLMKAGFEPAIEYVDAAFTRAKWTGDLTDEAVEEILAAPVAYDVAFREIKRENGKPVEGEKVGTNPEDVLRQPTVQDIDAIKAEIADLEGQVEVDSEDEDDETDEGWKGNTDTSVITYGDLFGDDDSK